MNNKEIVNMLPVVKDMYVSRLRTTLAKRVQGLLDNNSKEHERINMLISAIGRTRDLREHLTYIMHNAPLSFGSLAHVDCSMDTNVNMEQLTARKYYSEMHEEKYNKVIKYIYSKVNGVDKIGLWASEYKL